MSDAYNAGRRYEAPEEQSQLVNLWRVVKERWWVVLLTALLCTGAALAIALTTSDSYEATARLLFRDPGLSGAVSGTAVNVGSTDPQRNAATNTELVRSTEVATLVQQDLGLQESPADLLDQTTIASEENTDIVDITVADPDPGAAALIANSFADQYVAFRRTNDREGIRQGEKLLTARIDDLPEDSAERATLEDALRTLVALEAVQTGNVETIDTASAPLSPASPQPKRDGALGLIFGLVLGVSLVLLLDLLDRRVKTVEDFERRYGLRALTVVPQRVFANAGREAGVAEPFLILRSAVDYRASWKPMKVILVTSASPGEGKTSVAVNLARSVAAGGQRVVLVEADLRRPSVGQHVDLGAVGPGLSTALAMDAPVGELVVVDDEIPNLRVLPSGPPPPNPSELVRRRRMSEILQALAIDNDLVVVDSPPLLPVADSQTLLSLPQIDACIVVARAFRTTRQQISRTRAIIQRHAKEPLGLVICGTKDRVDAYYDYQPPVSGKGQPRLRAGSKSA